MLLLFCDKQNVHIAAAQAAAFHARTNNLSAEAVATSRRVIEYEFEFARVDSFILALFYRQAVGLVDGLPDSTSFMSRLRSNLAKEARYFFYFFKKN